MHDSPKDNSLSRISKCDLLIILISFIEIGFLIGFAIHNPICESLITIWIITDSVLNITPRVCLMTYFYYWFLPAVYPLVYDVVTCASLLICSALVYHYKSKSCESDDYGNYFYTTIVIIRAIQCLTLMVSCYFATRNNEPENDSENNNNPIIIEHTEFAAVPTAPPEEYIYE